MVQLKFWRILSVSILCFCLVFTSCAKKIPTDLSTPENTLKTLLTAMFYKDADAFLHCMTEEQLLAYGNSPQAEEARLRESIKHTRGYGHSASEFEITKRLESKGRVRLEFQLKKKFLTRADDEGWRGAHLFIRKTDGWKSYGVDVYRAGKWIYTKEDPFTPQYQ